METLKLMTHLIFYGIRDCVSGLLSLRTIWSIRKETKKSTSISHASRTKPKDPSKDKTIFHVLKECIVFGILYFLPIYVFRYLFLGKYFDVQAQYWLTAEEISSIAWLPGFLDKSFCIFWILPLFCFSRILNFSWYQSIADIMVDCWRIKKKLFSSFSLFVGDQIESLLVQFIFLFQGQLFFYLPIPALLQNIFATIHLALLYSLYSFEYKWVQIGWTLPKRLNYISSKWPYFIGFGLPLTLISSYIGRSYVENICIFSVLFPLCLISSMVTVENNLQTFTPRIKFFQLSYVLADFVFCHLPFLS